MKKQFTTMMLTGTLLLAGCSGGSSAPTVSKEDALANTNATGFPIVNEAIDLTFFTGKATANNDNFEERMVWSTYQDQTKMNINFEEVPFEGLSEKVNLTLASQDYPDAFYSARLNSKDLTTYGKQGVFIPLNDLLEEYAPNFSKLLDENPDLRKGLTMADGNIYAFPSFYDPEFTSLLIGTPIWVKQSFLDELGMEAPTTTEEFYQYLKAVKENDLVEGEEIAFSGTSLDNMIMQLRGSWGVGNRGLAHKHVDVDPETGELRFTRTLDEYKEILTYMNKLYTEGLIDQDIFTQSGAEFNAKGAEGRIGAVLTGNPVTQMTQDDYVGLGALEGPDGDSLYSHVKQSLMHIGAFAITDRNPYPEATVRWMDHFFGDEGATFYFMGKEGETYNVAEDGKLAYTENITNNPDGLSQDQALAEYFTWLGGSYPGIVKQKYFNGSEALPNAVETGDRIEPHLPEEIWNAFNYTDEELQFMSSTAADMETFIGENEAKFVTGEKPLSEWDSYVEQVESMGLDQYMEIENAAYERYTTAE
ncbi:carbohydrate ABC transporter substrate-binding protein (CUT1 family) [Aureibacillus halotolerans]|uniref:Carbohydrate ABC transporter substrate-binding protein (CUT1 family) n=2 Tax=Aureibacillus halotolerans TaxID=1508390 RepID=A0A4R6UCY8_9BACI|nr:carbohydrate ABC transporter substrate-binding protein (CUT1 family) [Aureibacillus halotolerans]